MKKLVILSFMLVGAALLQVSAQSRYLDEVFSSYTATPVIYDTNMWVPPFSGSPTNVGPRPQSGVIYTPPDEDTITKRPVIIYMHTGSFLPPIVNQQTTGNINDSAVVEMCRRFAKRGFVAVAISNRLGWNPATDDNDVATGQLLNATYRALQDAKNAIRFVRANADSFGVDTSRIILGGQGTGGYASLAAATVNKYSEITLGKFINTVSGQPYVDTALSGDWNGLGGSALNIPGDASIPTNFHFEFNLGGAMGDSIWLEKGDVPMVAFHCLNDPFAPYGRGNVIVPTTGLVVISNASGGKVFMDKANRLGNNDSLNVRKYDDVYTHQAAISSQGTANLYTFRFGQFPIQSAPWEWWDRTAIQGMGQAGITADSTSMLTNPDMSEAKAKAYIDTIQGFLIPRIVVALNLPGQENYSYIGVGVKEVASLNNKLTVFPVPAHDVLNIQLPVAMESVSILDITGRVLLTERMQGTQGRIETSTLHQGIYFAHVKTMDGRLAVKRFIVE